MSIKNENPAKTNFLFRAIQNHYRVSPQVKSASRLEREKWLIRNHVPFNRWASMPAAFLVQFCSGSLYSWSIFNKPIDLLIYNENRNMAPITFYIAIGFFGLAAITMGPWLERRGPFATCALGTTLFFTGNLITALALHLKLIWLVFIGYGMVAGFGLGACYITPVSTLQKWFPERRGLAAGFAVCGFGAGSIVISKVQLPLIALVGLPLTFVTLGSIYFMCMMLSACVLRTPPPNYAPDLNNLTASEEAPAIEIDTTVKAGKKQEYFKEAIILDDVECDTKAKNEISTGDPTLAEAVTSTDFRLLMIMFSSCILFGLVLVSRLSNIITDVFGRTAEEASTIVAINGGFNLSGRLITSIASDYIGRKNCFFLLLTLQAIILGCFSTMTSSLAYFPFIITMWIVTMCYGSAFGVLPALLSDKFGASNIGACHGIVLSGWSFSGIVGGLLFTTVFNCLLSQGYSSSDPYPYNINVWWIFGVVCIGWVALTQIRPTAQDSAFLERISSCFKCSPKKSWSLANASRLSNRVIILEPKVDVRDLRSRRHSAVATGSFGML